MARPTRSPERSGPHDADDVHADLSGAPGIVDFGAVRVPVPERGTITVEPGDNGRMQAVHISLPEGRLSVSALASPKSSRLWPDLVKEIDASLREGGARVRSFQGEWGRELHATSGAATSVFVGVDGARWMLYGVATGPTRDAAPLLEELRHMVRGTIVVRGRSPYPVRTVLPMQPPGHLADDASDPAIGATPTVVVRAVAPAAADEDSGDEPAGGPAAAPITAGRGQRPVAPAADLSGPTSAIPVLVGGVRPNTGYRPAAGPSRPVDAVRDPDDRTTDVWPDGLPGSRGHGPPRPATPPGRRPALSSPWPPGTGAFRAAPPHPAGTAPTVGLRPTSAPIARPPTAVPPIAETIAGPEVLRRGRHAAPETQDTGSRSPRPVDTDPVTEPLPLIGRTPRPVGRHRRRE